MRTPVSLAKLLLKILRRCERGRESQREYAAVLSVRPVINGRHEVVHLKSRRLLASSRDRVSPCLLFLSPSSFYGPLANMVEHCANVYRDFPEHHSRNRSVRKYQC